MACSYRLRACAARTGLPTQFGWQRRATHDFRQNAITGDWVVYAKDRGSRPKQTVHDLEKQRCQDFPPYKEDCPFCKGNEHMTASSLLEIPGEPFSWNLRVIENKYPGVAKGEDGHHWHKHQRQMEVSLADDDPTTNTIPAIGHHEVVIESPRHNDLLATQPVAATERMIRAWWQRGRDLRQDSSVRHTVYFKNHGGAAGASLVHPHSQIIALPIVATQNLSKYEIARRFYARHQVTVFQRTVEVEKAAGVRVIDENEAFLAIVPYAALCPFEIMILPKNGAAYFEECGIEELTSFSNILHRCLRRMHTALDEPSFNMILRTAPLKSRQAFNYNLFYSWHLSIYPRLGAGAMGGFEIASSIFSNSTSPESNAQALRDCAT